MPVTANEIAKACGISRGTVDRALNNRPGINPETKEKILKTAKELGYKPDFLAKSLVTGKTSTIGVVVFDVYTRFFGQLVTSIEMAARESGYFTYLTLTHKNPEEELRCIEQMVERKVDGIILFSINKGPDFDKFLSGARIPAVSVINKINDKYDYVGIDDKLAVEEGVGLLMNHGHRNIIYISSPINTDSNVNMYAVERRMQGFIDGCSKFGISVGKKDVIEATENYKSEILARVASDKKPTAIMCSNDIYALEIMKVLKKNGYNIPGDISLMGFDNIDTLEYIEPGLTTVGSLIKEMGKDAVSILLDRMDEEGRSIPKEHILKHELVIRQSVGRV